MWVLALSCLVLALLPIVVTFLTGNDKEFWAKAGLFLGFGFGAVYCFGEAAFVRGTFNDEVIVYSTPWTGEKNERWEDLVSADFNEWCSWYVLLFRSGAKIRLSNYLGGHLSALDSAQKWLAEDPGR